MNYKKRNEAINNFPLSSLQFTSETLASYYCDKTSTKLVFPEKNCEIQESHTFV